MSHTEYATKMIMSISDSLRSWSAKYVCKSLIEKFEEEMETEREKIIHSQSTLRVKNCLNAQVFELNYISHIQCETEMR